MAASNEHSPNKNKGENTIPSKYKEDVGPAQVTGWAVEILQAENPRSRV